ncbi:HK97 family phage prohead protease [Pseudarthrobacter sulfonivorans]|uniref:HK97 family phage prohead protease n=1 Tax=Pseudarthrobacter sulfonivorans TaxID=121292 RepID=UPI0009FAB491|nr:HK97 family phage prohead protease [Pseudarthrobacter sulfonivorans]
MIPDPQEAARERAASVSARANRPSQRRCSEEDGSPARVSARAHGIQIRQAEGDSALQFEGLASVYERGYEMYDYFGPYTEVVSAGAATDSLSQAGLDVPLVLQHQDLRRIARTTNGSLILTETDEGLHVNAPELDATDHDVQYIVPKLRSGLIDEMSFKFRITSGVWSPDYTEYRIQAFDIHRGDVAIVGYGASPHTAGAGLRASNLPDLIRDMDDTEARQALAELRARFPMTGRDLIANGDTALRHL